MLIIDQWRECAADAALTNIHPQHPMASPPLTSGPALQEYASQEAPSSLTGNSSRSLAEEDSASDASLVPALDSERIQGGIFADFCSSPALGADHVSAVCATATRDLLHAAAYTAGQRYQPTQGRRGK
ncbi:hypothetical protein AcV7_005764 [Taiwanofungus camphoratus]|nr:hypothetical protein AcV7_005764 [Antrodia cinnamomea]